MASKRLAIVLILAWLPAPWAISDEKSDRPVGPLPRADLSPSRVVEIQVEALQHVDRPAKDAGIATTFRFASPQNREATGPLERFALIVKGPVFQPMLNHRIAGYGRFIQVENQARREVTIIAADGQVFDYEFLLSKDPASGCWFTDGVVPQGEKPAIDAGKVAWAS